MSELHDQLHSFAALGTPAEKRLARFFIENMNNLPFETAASIAETMRVSPMTVSRFLRRLGFRGVDALKGALRSRMVSSAWQIADGVDLHQDLKEGQLLAELMAEQITTLHRLYEMSNQPPWTNAVNSILAAREIFVASYQNIGGIAQYFSEQLNYARDGVHYMDGLSGTYVELLDHPPERTLLILVDCRRFASKSRLLAKAAVEAGHSILVVTDQYCDWIDAYQQNALVLPASRYRAWDSFMSLAALLDFLVTAVVSAGGDAIRRRTKRIVELQDLFGDFEKR